MDSDEPLPKLGSLAQTARSGQLKQARGILIVIGILMILGNIVFAFMERDLIKVHLKKEIDKQGVGFAVDQQKLQEIEDVSVRAAWLIHGAAMACGAILILLGILVYRAPVACTVTGLVIYIGVNLVFGALAPESLYQGLILKAIIIVCLAKAVSAAVAYQREQASVDL